MTENERRAFLYLAQAINQLSDALGQIKPEAVKINQSLLGGSFQGSLQACHSALKQAVEELDKGG